MDFEYGVGVSNHKRVDNIFDSIKRNVTFQIVAIMDKDLPGLSKLKLTLDHVIDIWNSWEKAKISARIHSRIFQHDMKTIWYFLMARKREQHLILYEFHRCITATFESIQTELSKLMVETNACNEDEDALGCLLRAYDWTISKLNKSHATSIIESLLLCKLRRAIKDYTDHRDQFLVSMAKCVNLSKISEEDQAAAKKTIYVGPYPMLLTLRENIMKIPCIASATPNESESSKNESDSKEVKLSTSAAAPSKPVVDPEESKKRKRADEN